MPLCHASRFLVIENSSFEWLGKLSMFGCASAGRKAYGALGVHKKHRIQSRSLTSDHWYPAAQIPELTVSSTSFCSERWTARRMYSRRRRRIVGLCWIAGPPGLFRPSLDGHFLWCFLILSIVAISLTSEALVNIGMKFGYWIISEVETGPAWCVEN